METITDTISLESAFGQGEMIPTEYSCEGGELSPPLVWSNVPEETGSFVLLVEDADSSPPNFVHWMVFNIPGEIRELREGASSVGSLPKGAVEGMTDFGDVGYGGPCPPEGIHRYHFRLYALNAILDLEEGVTRRHLLREMEGHVLARGELIGRYGMMG